MVIRIIHDAASTLDEVVEGYESAQKASEDLVRNGWRYAEGVWRKESKKGMPMRAYVEYGKKLTDFE